MTENDTCEASIIEDKPSESTPDQSQQVETTVDPVLSSKGLPSDDTVTKENEDNVVQILFINIDSDENNVNFETGTINSKQELWPKNPEKTSKTVLKMKSVYIGMMILFFRGQFWTCFKNGSDYEIYYKIFVQNIASKRKSDDTGTMIFFLGSIFKLIKKC